MAITKELSFTAERKFSDKVYGSLGYAMSETITLEDGDNREKEYRMLKKRVGKRASEMNDEIRQSIKEQ